MFSDLLAFIAVVRLGSITRAAAQLGLSQPAVSRTIRALEERLGVSLLMRSTRKLSPTEAGQRLFDRLGPQFDQVNAEINALKELRDTPTGTLRITAIDYAVRSTLWPKLVAFMRRYPDIKVEVISEYAMVDIAAHGYDAGIRFGELIAQDMVSVCIGPDIRNTVVCTPAYLARRTPPATPHELIAHDCINLRTSTHGALYPWEFVHGDQTLDVRVDGPLVFNNAYDILDGALAGFGMAYLPEDLVRPHLDRGQLVQVLEDWCPVWSGFHLYYPSRRQHSRAMALLIEALRYVR
jgi:DNA-binding transcriptional LysR family regulator